MTGVLDLLHLARIHAVIRYSIALLTLALAMGAAAQPRLPLEGPDASQLPLGEAVALVEGFQLNRYGAETVMVRAASSGDASLRPRLRAIAEAYVPVQEGVAFTALHALWELGEPESYFVENIAQAESDPVSAYYSAWVAARDPNGATLSAIEAELTGPDLLLESAALTYREVLELDRQYAQASFDGQPVTDDMKARGLLNIAARAYRFEWPLDAWTVPVDSTDYLTYLHPEAVWARDKLRALVATRSRPVLDALRGFDDDPFFQDEYGDALRPDVWEDVARDYVTFMEDEVLPPINEQAEIVPLIECVGADELGRPAVYFGYDNLHGEPVRIPAGPRNSLLPPALDGEQTTVFGMPETVAGRPGRTAHFPDYAFAVLAEDATWSLSEYAAGVSDSPPACNRYLPDWQALDRLPAAATVQGNASASFSGSSFYVSGAPHSIDGSSVSGPAVLGVAAGDEAARTAVLSALSAQQSDRVVGALAEPAVGSADLLFDVGTWVDVLASRAALVVPTRPGDDIGSVDAPALAYAPDGVRLSGGVRGHGLLVVDGPFEMTGNAEWVGLVIVRGGSGQTTSEVTGNVRVIGGLVLTGADGAPASLRLAGNAEILYSPQAIALARAVALGSQ